MLGRPEADLFGESGPPRTKSQLFVRRQRGSVDEESVYFYSVGTLDGNVKRRKIMNLLLGRGKETGKDGSKRRPVAEDEGSRPDHEGRNRNVPLRHYERTKKEWGIRKNYG